MKNQYFGDINDYRKYGILRSLAGGDVRILICWMLTPNDARSDGKFIDYLKDPDRWRAYDPMLFDVLQKEVQAYGRRDVACFKERVLIGRATFVDAILNGKEASRCTWLAELRLKRLKADLVFFDPDNGIEVRSVPKTRRDSRKYVYWDEIEETWRSGASLLVYQHFRREPRDRFLEKLSKDFRDRLDPGDILVLRTANVAFFLVIQPQHAHYLLQRAQSVSAQWQEQIKVQRV